MDNYLKLARLNCDVTTDAEPETLFTESACEPHREQIEADLLNGRNAMSIWQALVDQHGFPLNSRQWSHIANLDSIRYLAPIRKVTPAAKLIG